MAEQQFESGVWSDDQRALAVEWKRLTRAATFVALLTSPLIFALLYYTHRWALGWALLGTFLCVIAFRGAIDLLAHRLIPRPSLYGADRDTLLDDATARRRWWYWRGKYRLLMWLLVIVGIPFVVLLAITGDSPGDVFSAIGNWFSSYGLVLIPLGIQIPLLFIANVGILFGPLLAANLMQMKGYEPGDADWGVKLGDVRGQREPKEEVTRVISLWQSGEEFRRAGGKPERGLLFIGAPGTGKTMLSKAIATSFNSPIVTMPGSGFAATFIGIDVLVVMLLIRKARRLARKWGGQCIIFIDEIDAVGLRRQALGQGTGMTNAASPIDTLHDLCFHGPNGALTADGELVYESRAWRERLFEARAERPGPFVPPVYRWLGERANRYMFPGMFGGGGGMALNQLLVQMDGVDQPPFMRKFWTNRINNFLDATYIVPRRVGSVSLRMAPPKPRPEQIYFIGATNVPIEQLDPALLRPGRMGRHIWFRTPTKDDRKDIFELYMAKVAHDPELDSDKRRDELARITNGYSPAMIEQICSMALTLAHADARAQFEWQDIVEAMTTIESGTAQGIDYIPSETRAVAIHEAGHAAASHVYEDDQTSVRLSIRKRGGSLGHHYAIEKEERFTQWRHEVAGRLVTLLAAMAAEHVFYGENGRGVSHDIETASTLAALMVGVWGMGPERVEIGDRRFRSDDERLDEEERIMQRYERIGQQIINRSRGQREQGDMIASILSDPIKRAAAARILGQAYITAYCLIQHNREAVGRIAETLIRRRELHGDEVVEVLDAAGLEAPAIDIHDEATWPAL